MTDHLPPDTQPIFDGLYRHRAIGQAVRLACPGKRVWADDPVWRKALGLELPDDDRPPDGLLFPGPGEPERRAFSGAAVVCYGPGAGCQIEEAVCGWMSELPPGGVLLVESYAGALLATPGVRLSNWRQRWALHTVFYVSNATAIGWWTTGRRPVDDAIKLFPVS